MNDRTHPSGLRRIASNHLLLLVAFGCAHLGVNAAVPPVEKLLPDDTLVVISVPDFAKAKELYNASAPAQLWQDEAMKAFREKFIGKLKEELIAPLERELNIKFDDYTSLPQGQLTFAVVQAGWEGKEDQSPAILLLVDTKEKSGQLKKNLTDLRKKWVDAGKPIKTEKIRDVEFSIVTPGGTDLSKSLKETLPDSPDSLTLIAEGAPPPKATPRREIFIGQADSLLILGNSSKGIEKMLIHLSGGAVPALGELATFEANQASMFRDAAGFCWVNAKKLLEIAAKADEAGDADAPANALGAPLGRIISITGLNALKSVAFSLHESGEGSMFHLFLTAPDSGRQGILKILAGEAKETAPPRFVPADAAKYQRWRLDGQKAWATLEKMLNDISPQAGGVVNFMLETASAGAKEKDPDFDIRKNLLGNLGDDLIAYQKSPRGTTLTELNSPPSLFLIGSPRPEQLVNGLKVIMGIGGQAGGAPKEREFLGRKIYSLPLPQLPLTGAVPGAARELNCTASGGYVALSTDPAMLEEFLRSSESQGKTLRETIGLAEATQKVTATGTSMFGYENGVEAMRTMVEVLKRSPNPLGAPRVFPPVPGGPGGATVENKDFKDWVDVSLLPSFDKIAKYFHFTVYGMSANADGISLKYFSPVPPEMKKGGASEPAKR